MIDRGVLITPPLVGQFYRSVGAQSTTQLWRADPLTPKEASQINTVLIHKEYATTGRTCYQRHAILRICVGMTKPWWHSGQAILFTEGPAELVRSASRRSLRTLQGNALVFDNHRMLG